MKKHSQEGLGLVVLLHGLGGNNGQMRALAKAIAATGECVAVAPSAKPLPEGEGGEDGVPPGGMFIHWWLYDNPRSFPLEAIRKARSLYPIDPERVAISGHSMGGYGTWNISLRRPDVFCAIAPLAGGLSRKAVIGGQEPEETRSLLENGKLLEVFAVHGTKDPIVPLGPDERACKRLEELEGKVELRKLEGIGHMIEGVWAGQGDTGKDLVRFLTSKRRESSPEHVTYVSWNEKTDGAYWLRIAKRKKPMPPKADGEEKAPPVKARLEARVDRARNRIVLESENVSLARVYVDDRLLDLSKPVTVEAGGAVRFEGKLAPDLRSVLESWRSRQDERLVYPAFVEVDPRKFH
ncbi:hypothetical protein HY251_22290 [bacterium]|nr:hypothetical protein [bacterium]